MVHTYSGTMRFK